MGRTEYHNDPNAPKPNSLVVAVSAVVTNDAREILLHRRSDNELWSVPGGAMELGESISQAVAREVKEETGFEVEAERLVGIYSNPGHIVAYSDGEVRQQFSICFACRVVGGDFAESDESLDVRFFTPADVSQLPMSESVRLRVDHFLEGHSQPVIA
jgi:ADP-ribose pyrophosphatase YjhB (NUDIX family)